MFWIAALLLALLVACSLAWPWLVGGKREEDVSAQAQNKALWKTQIAQLQQQLDDGEIGEEEFNALKQELDRRLLQDVDQAEEQTVSKQSSPVFMAGLVAVTLLLGFMAYQHWGNWQAHTLTERYQVLMDGEELAPEDVLPVLDDMRAYGTNKQEKGFDWLVLAARGYVQVQHYRKASETFDTVLALNSESPTLLAEAAQAHYMSNGKLYQGKAKDYVDSALAINPNQANALGFAGMASFEQADYNGAVDYWQRLIAILPASEQQGSVLVDALAEAKRRASLGESTEQVAVVDDTAVTVNVSLNEGISVDANTTVFVTARAVSGPPVPLAVKRLRVADLPTTVVLSSSDAMSPQFTLEAGKEVTVKAKVSLSGNAISQPGDIEAIPEVAVVGEAKTHTLVIEHTVQ